MFKKLIKRIKENRMTFISIIAILFIPVLYAGNFIAAFADPYNNLSQVKVAIVNNDTDITSEDEVINIGKSFVESLKETDNFKWVFVSEKEANRGMENNEYYFKVEIPEDFTKNIYSTLNGTAKTANLIYSTNDNNNYISGVLGGALVSELNKQLNEKVITTFITKLGTSLSNVNQLSIGVTALLNGSDELNSGVNKLVSGSATLNESTNKLYTSSVDLKNGMNSLTTGYNTFNSGLSSASSSLSSISGGYSLLNSSMISYEASLESAINSSATLTAEQKTELINTYKTILGKSAYLNGSLSAVNTGVSTLSSNSSNINNSISKLNVGTSTISSYLLELNKGTESLYNGITTLSSGSQKLYDGLNTLNSGVSELTTKLNSLNLVNNASNLSSPVTELDEPYSKVENYGYGFAPYFVSLGLFVGALIATIVVNAKVKKKKNEKFSLKRTLKKMGLYASIVVTQTLILDALVLSTCIQIDNNLLFIIFTLLTSIMYMSIIEMLSTLFGDPGRFVAIILLILQLTACGGTFPVETAPTFYNMIHMFMPMTYTVEGLRIIIGSGNMSILFSSIMVLVGIIVACYSITLLYFKKSKCFK